MSTLKEQKPELIAIYRLEFYKKQKNWKLSTTHKEKKTSKKSTENINLNVTYNIEQPEALEPSDAHNIAFVECDSDPSTNIKCSKLDLIKDKELSQEWQEPVNIWPKTEPLNEQNENTQNPSWTIFDDKNQIQLHSAPKTNTQTRLDELQKAARSFETEEQAHVEGIMGLRDAWREHRSNEYYHWPVECGFTAGNILQNVWTQATEDVTDGYEYDLMNNVQSTEELYPPSYCGDAYWTPELLDDSVMSVDSEGEFLRGADAAPHSSESELRLPPCVHSLDVSFRALSRLSSAQLVLAARAQQRVLRRLLREGQHRQKLRNASSFYSLSSFEEFPTRDPGPRCPSEGPGAPFDVFVAGSHRLAQGGRGRGRGRLAEGAFL